MMSSLASFVIGGYSELDGFSSIYCVCKVKIVLTTRQSQPGGYLSSVLLQYRLVGTFGAAWYESQAFSFAFSNVLFNDPGVLPPP